MELQSKHEISSALSPKNGTKHEFSKMALMSQNSIKPEISMSASRFQSDTKCEISKKASMFQSDIKPEISKKISKLQNSTKCSFLGALSPSTTPKIKCDFSKNQPLYEPQTKCGLGLRAEFLGELAKSDFKPDFWEIVPENWLFMPFFHRQNFENIINNSFVVAHGVSLSLGSNTPVDMKFLTQIKRFLNRYEIKHYSDHISFSSLNGHNTHELLPIPLTKNMLQMLCEKVDLVQNFLKRELILENATFYYKMSQEMSESEFINELSTKSGAKILLDVNNIFINSLNHGFNARKFIDEIELKNVAYIHVAGHLDGKIIVDTHGNNVCDGVWDLLNYTLKKRKIPTMIERDNDIPSLNELILEYEKLREIYKNASK